VAISYSASADQVKTVVADLEAKGVRVTACQADQSDVAQAAGSSIRWWSTLGSWPCSSRTPG